MKLETGVCYIYKFDFLALQFVLRPNLRSVFWQFKTRDLEV